MSKIRYYKAKKKFLLPRFPLDRARSTEVHANDLFYAESNFDENEAPEGLIGRLKPSFASGGVT